MLQSISTAIPGLPDDVFKHVLFYCAQPCFGNNLAVLGKVMQVRGINKKWRRIIDEYLQRPDIRCLFNHPGVIFIPQQLIQSVDIYQGNNNTYMLAIPSSNIPWDAYSVGGCWSNGIQFWYCNNHGVSRVEQTLTEEQRNNAIGGFIPVVIKDGIEYSISGSADNNVRLSRLLALPANLSLAQIILLSLYENVIKRKVDHVVVILDQRLIDAFNQFSPEIQQALRLKFAFQAATDFYHGGYAMA